MTAQNEASPLMTDTPQGQSVRATAIIGGASIANVLLGLVRMKIAAIVLGPTGIGTIGILQNLLNAAATVGGLNLGVTGARQIVESKRIGGESGASSARRAVYLSALSLGVVSSLTFWVLRQPLAELVFQDRGRSVEVGWLALGVGATIAAGYQAAVLNAQRRIREIALLSILSALCAALVGSVCIILWRANGVLPFILAAPIATLAFGWIFVRRATIGMNDRSEASVQPHVLAMVRLGTAVTFSIFASLCGQLAIRTLIERELGTIALGHFQAAWTITTVYLVFIFQAMASDYLPRLTASLDDPKQTEKLVEGQAEIGLLVGAPILLTMIGAAPLVLSILYTSEFIEAAVLLRYQMLGDLIRLAVWPMTLVLLAGGASRDYALADLSGTVLLTAGTFLLLPVLGLMSPGLAYALMNLAYGALILLLVRRRYKIGLSRRVVTLFFLLAVCCVLIVAISSNFALLGTIAGIMGAVLWGFIAYYRLRSANAFPWLHSKN